MPEPFLDATAQAELVRTNQVSPAELVDEAIDRIEELNGSLNAVITPLFEKARAQAAGPLPDGPFKGVPLLLKDLLCTTEGDLMAGGTRLLKELGYRAPHDTYLAERFKRAGFVVLGKTNTPELGILPTTEPDAFGPTRNPWHPDHSTGGSSGGSAAAVSSGMVSVAHGNDGGGSIRIPASECALVGLKPTRGRTSLGPDLGDVMGGLVCEHVLTRSVRDTAAILDAVAGAAPGDPYVAPAPAGSFLEAASSDPGPLRVGLFTEPATGAAHPDCVAAAEETARILESLGHRVEVAHPPALDEPDFAANFITLWSIDTAAEVEYWSVTLRRHVKPDELESLTWALVEMGRSFSGPQALLALGWLQGYARRVQQWWVDGFDLLLTPTIAEPPPLLGQFGSPPDNPLAGLFRAGALVPFTPPFNVTGQPAISLPLYWNGEGLPIGSQLVASFGREELLISVAARLEEASPWAGRRPPVSAS